MDEHEDIQGEAIQNPEKQSYVHEHRADRRSRLKRQGVRPGHIGTG